MYPFVSLTRSGSRCEAGAESAIVQEYVSDITYDPQIPVAFCSKVPHQHSQLMRFYTVVGFVALTTCTIQSSGAQAG